MISKQGAIMTSQKRSSSFMTWDEVVAHCDTIDDVTPDEKRDAKDAYRRIEARFGQSFLSLAHPSSHQIANRAPWTRKWVVEFAGIVERSSRLPNFDGIRRKLKDAERYDEGHDLIRLADALVNTGFEVEFKPALPKSVPDLGVTRGN